MKDVTLLASGPSHIHCRYNTEELWGCMDNLVNPHLSDKPYNLVFAFDGLEMTYNGVKKPNNVLKASLKVARERGIPVVSIHDYADIIFPTRDIVRKYKSSYLMPTISYMIAYALYTDHSPIWLNGIDGGPGWQYQFGKPHITHWLGIACGAGHQIMLGKGSLGWAFATGLAEYPREIIVNDTEKMGKLVSEYEG